MERYLGLHEVFWKWIHFQVGNGDKVKFWTNIWRGEVVFKDRFPQLYRLALDQDANVANYLVRGIGGFFWDIRLRRYLQDWELAQFLSYWVQFMQKRG